jgi:hypothetical protein
LEIFVILPKTELRLRLDEVPPGEGPAIILATIPQEVEMATALDTMSIKELAVELGSPEGSERNQQAKAELTYRQLKGLEQQQIAMLVQMRAIEVQRGAATIEAKAAEAITISVKAAEKAARAAERNSRYLLWSVFVTLILAVASAVSAYYSYWIAVHPR